MSKYIVCPVCEGEGTTVNPAIDANGLDRDDYDPDFFEDYQNGVYDVQCGACHGQRVVTPDTPDRLSEAAADRRLAAMEDGNFEAYCHAHDYRYGA